MMAKIWLLVLLASSFFQVQGFVIQSNSPTCSESNSCLYRKTCKTALKAVCQCDVDCVLYNDCCPDVFSSCLGFADNDTKQMFDLVQEETSRDTGRIKLWAEKKQFRELSECRSTRGIEGDIWMVSKCPSDWEDESIRDKCEHDFKPLGYDHAVSYKKIRYITFANVNCAVCNGVPPSEVVHWEWKGPCEINMNFNGTVDSDEAFLDFLGKCADKIFCLLAFPKEGFTPRLCELQYPLVDCDHLDNLTSAQILDREYCTACNLIRSPIQKGWNDPVVKNTFCEKALNISNGDMTCKSWKNANRFFFLCIGMENLFKFNTDSGLATCEENEIQVGQDCKAIVCSEGYIVENGICVVNPNVTFLANGSSQIFPQGSSDTFIDIHFPSINEANDFIVKVMEAKLFHPFWKQLEFKNNFTERSEDTGSPITFAEKNDAFLSRCESVGHAKSDLFDDRDLVFVEMLTEVPSVLHNVSMHIETMKIREVGTVLNPNSIFVMPGNPTATNTRSLILSNSFTLSFALNNNSGLSKEAMKSIYDWYFSVIPFIPVEYPYAFSIRNFHAQVPYQCPALDARAVENVIFEVVENITYLKVDEQFLFPLENVLYSEVLGSSVRADPCNLAMVCAKRSLACGSVDLYGDEYQLTKHNEVNIDGYVLELKEGSYILDGEKLSICANLIKSFKNEVERIVAISLSSLTILALVITFIVYSLLPDLRNLPGKCLMSLCVTLSLAHILIILDRNENKPVCFGIAIAAHFMWLASFCWMTLMAFDIAMTFHGMASGAGGRGGGKFKRYCMSAYSFPALIVIVAAILDVTNETGLHVGYGKRSLCWITDGMGALVFFGVPVLVSVVFNLGFFVLILRSIEKTTSESSMATDNSNNKKRYFAYLRISFIMGFTWLFGFLDGWIDHPALFYTYVILNGLQGVFIAVSFLANDRTRSLFRKRFGDAESGFSTRSTSQPSTSVGTKSVS